MTLNTNQKQLRRKLLTHLYNAHTSHIGSCLSVIDIIDSIYQTKNNNEKFVLSNGHAGAALYVVLEKFKYILNADLIKYNVHPDRNEKKGIDVSTGSLGQGLPIAVGMALANKTNVYCLISDGECAEGSIWESLKIIHDLNITNIKIFASINGFGAYDPINSLDLKKKFTGFGFKIIEIDGHNPKQIKNALAIKQKYPTLIFAKTNSCQLPFLNGIDAHYYTMKDCDYELAMEELK